MCLTKTFFLQKRKGKYDHFTFLRERLLRTNIIIEINTLFRGQVQHTQQLSQNKTRHTHNTDIRWPTQNLMNAESCGCVDSCMRTTCLPGFLQLIMLQRECVTGRTRVWHIIGGVSTYGTINVRVDKRGSWKESPRHFHRECGLCVADFAPVIVVTSRKGRCTLTRLFKKVGFGTSFSCYAYCGKR